VRLNVRHLSLTIVQAGVKLPVLVRKSIREDLQHLLLSDRVESLDH